MRGWKNPRASGARECGDDLTRRIFGGEDGSLARVAQIVVVLTVRTAPSLVRRDPGIGVFPGHARRCDSPRPWNCWWFPGVEGVTRPRPRGCTCASLQDRLYPSVSVVINAPQCPDLMRAMASLWPLRSSNQLPLPVLGVGRSISSAGPFSQEVRTGCLSSDAMDAATTVA